VHYFIAFTGFALEKMLVGSSGTAHFMLFHSHVTQNHGA